MSIPASLFVQPVFTRSNSVSNPKTLVFGAQDNFAYIDNILVINLINSPIFVSVYISTNDFMIIPPTEILPYSVFEILKGCYFSLNAGETLFATSDSSQNLFNISVEGRVFTEIPPQMSRRNHVR